MNQNVIRPVDAAHRSQLGRSTHGGFTLVELLVVLGIILILIALLLPAVRTAREPARRNACLNNLKQIAIALQNYADSHGGTFPQANTTNADGKPLHSWRTLILPYMEAQALYDSIDLTKPWDDRANSKACSTHLYVYQCPSATGRQDLDNRSTYLAIVTPKSCFRATQSRNLSDIADGVAHTLVVIDADAEHAVPWMSPHDADENLVLGLGVGESKTNHPGVILALFADGHSEPISVDTPAAERIALISIAGNDNAE
jgi:prepilin-type N-terminal cleavage/methylation domain-containing protein